MFGDLMGGMQEQQDAMREKLEGITINAGAGNGAVKVTVTASRKLVNISIDKSIVDPEDTEQMEDLILVAINEAMDLAAKKEAEMAQEVLRNMMPPGMGDLGNLF
jgi:DNA-binding YbaB/EbfC family protein